MLLHGDPGEEAGADGLLPASYEQSQADREAPEGNDEGRGHGIL